MTPTVQPGKQDPLVLTICSKTFTEDDAQDLGSYIGPHVQQTNTMLRSTDPAFPITVYFRRDVSGPHQEIVVQWGDIWSTTPADRPPCSATITQGKKTLSTINLPVGQYWNTRWRWQSAPRKVYSTPAKIVKDGWLEPLAPLSAPMIAITPQPAYKNPMDTSSIVTYMPTTGDRADIGPVTEYASMYMATEDPTALAAVLAWAEAAGSMPWHLTDSKTNAPLSWLQYPNANTYGSYCSPSLALGIGGAWKSANPVTLSTNHCPSLSFLAFLLTDDPYHLEEMQFAANWNAADYPCNGAKIFRHDETRTWAWALRDVFDAEATAPASPPSWLLPKSYWDSILKANLDWVTANCVNNPAPLCAVLRSGIDAVRLAIFEDDYALSVLGSRIGKHADWKGVFDWKVGSNMARVSRKSGWPQQMASAYWENLPGVTDWASLWADNPVTLPTDGSLYYDPDGGTNYPEIARGCMALAVANKTPGAKDGFAYLEPKVLDTCISHKQPASYRWAFALPPSAGPAT